MSLSNYEAWLDGGQLVCVESGMAAWQRDILLKSSLYFQFAATRQVEKSGAAPGWFDKYEQVMKAFGWRVLEKGSHHQRVAVLDVGQLIASLHTMTGVCRLDTVQSLFASPAQVPQQWLRQSLRTRMVGDQPIHEVNLLLGSAHSRHRLDTVLIRFELRHPSLPDLLKETFSGPGVVGEVSVCWLCGEPDGLSFHQFKPVILERLARRADGKPVRVDLPGGQP
ncbi:hypothetical protein [Pseudomonas sp. TE3610]